MEPPPRHRGLEFSQQPFDKHNGREKVHLEDATCSVQYTNRIEIVFTVQTQSPCAVVNVSHSEVQYRNTRSVRPFVLCGKSEPGQEGVQNPTTSGIFTGAVRHVSSGVAAHPSRPPSASLGEIAALLTSACNGSPLRIPAPGFHQYRVDSQDCTQRPL